MKTHSLGNLSQFLGNRVVYRNLISQDRNLPGFSDLAREIGLDTHKLPRKADPAYGQVIALLLQKAQQIDQPGKSLRSLVFIGDTRLNDGSAFANIANAGRWQAAAFIGSEKDQPAQITRDTGFDLALYNANRWSLLSEFPQICRQHGINLDQTCAVVLDLDKTSLGARGRNDKAIDRARTQAAEDVVRAIAGESFDVQMFSKTYQRFNQVEFHPFTTDNQDYLVYITLLAVTGVINVEELASEVQTGSLRAFGAFANKIQPRLPQLPVSVQNVQAEFYNSLQKGDPTPFKAFRRQEYRNTVTAMQVPLEINEAMLTSTICITQEVREFALLCKQNGCLMFGLSDKPDEASLPPLDLAQEGWLPLHQAAMLAVSVP